MINTNFKNKSVNFTAKLDISEMRNNKKLWSEVVDIFENKTKKTPYDFIVTNSDNRLDIYATTELNSDDYSEHCCTLTKKATKTLLSLDADSIAQKFVKLLNIFKHQDKTKVDTLAFLAKLEKADKYHTLNTPRYENDDSIYDRIFYPIFDKMKDDRIVAVEDDFILKDADFID